MGGSSRFARAAAPRTPPSSSAWQRPSFEKREDQKADFGRRKRTRQKEGLQAFFSGGGAKQAFRIAPSGGRRATIFERLFLCRSENIGGQDSFVCSPPCSLRSEKWMIIIKYR